MESNLEGAGQIRLLSAGDVEAGGRNGFVGLPLQAVAVENHLKKPLGPVGDGLAQVDPVRHGGNRATGLDEDPVGGAAVGAERLAVGVQPVGAGGRSDHGGEVAAAEKRVFGTADTRSVIAGLFVLKKINSCNIGQS